MPDPRRDPPTVVDLAMLAAETTVAGSVWSVATADLNVNLVVFGAGQGVAEHVNDEVDVLVVGIAGAGTVAVDGQARSLRAGQAVVIPKGARRAIRSAGERFAYLTCHRRRAGLWPAGAPRPAVGPAERL